MNYNKVILLGRVAKEPQTLMLPSGSQVSNLVIAYNRRYKVGEQEWKEETHFFEVKVYGKLAEKVIPQIEKGDLILVEGRLHQDRWEDKETGKSRSKVRIVALTLKIIAKSQKGQVQEKPIIPVENPEEFAEPFVTPELEVGTTTGEKTKDEDFEELESLIFGEEEGRKENKNRKENNSNDNKNKKEDDFDDFDILL